MKEFDINGLLRKTEELRALFVLGQRVIPFLEELFSFVGEIQPLLEEINKSIQENVSRMPSLSRQLSKVTEATELATTEILDIIDGILYKIDIIVNNLNSLIHFKKIFDSINEISKIISSSDLSPERKINEVSNLLINSSKENLNANEPSFDDLIQSTIDFVDKIKNDSTSIMLALQVQDITSQQIAAVNHLLNTVQNRLKQLISKFQSSDVENFVDKTFKTELNVSHLHRNIAFDPDAVESINNATARQEEIDAIFSNPTKVNSTVNVEPSQKFESSYESSMDSENSEDTNFSQSDIDKLFANQGS
ncbi:MAG: hypothetical protein ACUVQ1_04415 [Candidatus Kapaibacteriales bacterium]